MKRFHEVVGSGRVSAAVAVLALVGAAQWAQADPQGPPVVFQDVHLDTASTNADSVSGTAPLSGLRAWQFSAFNTDPVRR